MTTEPSAYFFDGIEVRPALRQVLADGHLVPLRARAFDLLMALVERRDRTVSKDELLDAVWSDASVEAHNLVVQIGHLRKLFGAQAISTIPGRGYRFTAKIANGQDRPTMQESGDGRIREGHVGEAAPEVFGRDADLAILRDMVSANRLVTIVGTGGVGKTRVAQVLLARLRSDYADGGAWVELDALADESKVAEAIARALQVKTGNAAPLADLVAALRPSRLLLVLDNAEHLVDGVAEVTESLLRAAPDVDIVVTSQAPLGLESEQVFRLEPLGIPPIGASVDEALSHGSVALFVRRAEYADRRFRLDESNVSAVVEICRRLDGIALAVEMAAARVPLLGVRGLTAALTDQLRILASRRRDVPQRQRSLRSTLEWSHRLLTSHEQAVLRRLAVFVGGFSLDLALSVVSDSNAEDDRRAAFDSLASLIDRSLVMTDGDDPPRYRLLDSTRTFAMERLAENELRRRGGVQRVAAWTAESLVGRAGLEPATKGL